MEPPNPTHAAVKGKNNINVENEKTQGSFFRKANGFFFYSNNTSRLQGTTNRSWLFQRSLLV